MKGAPSDSFFPAEEYQARWAQVHEAMTARGLNFIPYVIPIDAGEADPDGALRYDVPLEAGMVMAAEIFLTHPGVGTAGFEQNLIVTTGAPELLTRTPMLFG